MVHSTISYTLNTQNNFEKSFHIVLGATISLGNLHIWIKILLCIFDRSEIVILACVGSLGLDNQVTQWELCRAMGQVMAR